MPLVDPQLAQDLRAFTEGGQLGKDPLAVRYAERRKGYSLFARTMSDADIESLKPYLFCYQTIPTRPGEAKPAVRNFIAAEWRAPASGEIGRAHV